MCGSPRRRYHREALHAVLSMLATVSADTAALFAAIVAIRGERCGPDERAIDRAALATMLHLHRDTNAATTDDLDRAFIERAEPFTTIFAMNIFDTPWRRRALARQVRGDNTGAYAGPPKWLTDHPEAEETTNREAVLLSADFVALLDDAMPQASRSVLVPGLDEDGRRDVGMVETIMVSGVGAHLAWRRRAEAPRETDDLAAILGCDDRHVVVYDGPEDGCIAAILRAEFHAGPTPPIVFIDRDLLTIGNTAKDDDWDEPAGARLAAPVSALARTLPPQIVRTRGLYL